LLAGLRLARVRDTIVAIGELEQRRDRRHGPRAPRHTAILVCFRPQICNRATRRGALDFHEYE
jgi:hypothetical protein